MRKQCSISCIVESENTYTSWWMWSFSLLPLYIVNIELQYSTVQAAKCLYRSLMIANKKGLRFTPDPHKTNALTTFDPGYFHFRSHLLFATIARHEKPSRYKFPHCLMLVSRYFFLPTCVWCWINYCTFYIITTDAHSFVITSETDVKKKRHALI